MIGVRMGGGRLRGSGSGDWHDDCIDGSPEAFLGSSCRDGFKNNKPTGIYTPQL